MGYESAMRTLAFMAFALSAIHTPAMAQVTVDLRALEPLRPETTHMRASPRAPSAPVAKVSTRAPAPAEVPAATPPSAASTAALTPALPETAPAQAAPQPNQSIASIAPAPAALTIPFAAGQDALTANGSAALRDLAAKSARDPNTAFTIDAFIDPNGDPSTARRIALERGRAARQVLSDSGIATGRINVRLRKAEGDASADRIEVGTNSSGGTAPR